jgi:hypothetical protein
MNDKEIIRSFESGFDKRVIALTAVAILVVVALVGLVARGFKGHDVSRSASSLSPPTVETGKTAP